jgi:branched-chain amino acid transport system permease protein
MWNFLAFSISGIIAGVVVFIAAAGLVVTYSTTGIFNFAQGGVGMVSAFTFWALAYSTNPPLSPWAAFLVVLLVEAPLLGIITEGVFMRGLRNASVERQLMVTLGVMLLMLGAAQAIWSGQTQRALPSFFPSVTWLIGPENEGLIVTGQQIFEVVVAIMVAVGLWIFLRKTRRGTAMRAVPDNPELASLAGASIVRISRTSWILGSVLASLAGMLLAAGSPSLNAVELTLLVINGFAAAVVGRLRSLPMTFVGAVIIGLLVSYATGYLPTSWSWLQDASLALPMVFLFVVLLILPEDRIRAAGARLTVARPRVASRWRGVTGAVLVILGSIVAAFVLHGTALSTASEGMVFATVALSLVLLTGYSGLISLCQVTFVGIGAFVMGHVAGGGSWFGLVAAGVVGALCGMIIALPTLRLRGLYLALATLAFAQIATYLFFDPKTQSSGAFEVGRLGIPGLHLQTDRGQLVLAAALFAAASLVVLALRRATLGRRLVALDDAPAAFVTLGLSERATRLFIFATAAGLAGLAGALYGGQVVAVGSGDAFQYFYSLLLLLLVVICGVQTISGALAAGLLYAALISATTGQSWIAELPEILIGVGVVLLGRAPNGVPLWLYGIFAKGHSRQASEDPATTLDAGSAPNAKAPTTITTSPSSSPSDKEQAQA